MKTSGDIESSGYVPPPLPGTRQTKIDQVKSTIDSSIDTMKDNMVKMVERGNQIDVLLEKSDGFKTTSAEFYQRSRAIERRELFKKWASLVLIFLACVGILVLLYFVSLPAFIVALIIVVAGFSLYFWWYRRTANMPWAARMAVFRRIIPTPS